ncbi:Abi family protein [Glutamicibacter sp. NPDC087344]|uniref:Abi family protein n=1 Tax=Glutamicibacter sp. NPDC087344 TaxID=3363994 RepID=UPI0037F846BE
MACGSDEFAAAVLERYGYYRLSGYWHTYRQFQPAPAPALNEEGRENRLDTFRPGAKLDQVVSIYDFDQELRTRLSTLLSRLEISLRFFIGHRLGAIDLFAHRKPEVLGTLRPAEPGQEQKPTTAYTEWLTEYDRHESRARDEFVLHFRGKYGPHLPIWVATEVMSFGVLSNLYTLMPQLDQEVLAARFQVNTADGKGDRGAFANWLNALRVVRNICAHYGRVWNRVFDVIIDAPGDARSNGEHPLHHLGTSTVSNRLFGVLSILRYLLLSIAPDDRSVLNLVDFVTEQAQRIGFRLPQLGFPEAWENDELWDPNFMLDSQAMTAAGLLDQARSFTAAQTRAALTAAQVHTDSSATSPRSLAAAQRTQLRTYLHYDCLIEINIGKTKHYPQFQFRDGKIIDAVGDITQQLIRRAGDVEETTLAEALVTWWQTPNSGLPVSSDGQAISPQQLLESVTEDKFRETLDRVNASGTFML